MATTDFIANPNDQEASSWMSKVSEANKYYKNWADRFEVNTMEEYYYGFQWKDGSRAPNYTRYVINYVFSTLEIKKPTLLFQNLAAKIKPRAKSVDFDWESAVRRCQLREFALNTIISDPENEFADEFEMFIVDAFFRFGIMEVGYSADWIENPKAGMPILRSDNDPLVDPDDPGNVIKQPEELPENEQVYLKRIPAWRFRVGGIDGHNFKKCSWVGYYDFFRIEDLKANKTFKDKLKDIQYTGNRSGDAIITSTVETEEDDKRLQNSGDFVKVWTIFDLRRKEKILVLDDHCVTLFKKKFKRLPIVALKFVNKLRGWYPVPLVFNWKGPQDEINEAREQQRVHRRRGNRKYLYREGSFADDAELDKLENGPDMTFAKVTNDPSTAMVPLQNANLDSVTGESLALSRDDLNIITGTPSDTRGQPDRTTATQATIVDQRSQLRETRSRTQVANCLKSISRLVLLTIQEKFTLPLWIKISTVLTDQNFVEQEQEVQEEWRQIQASELGDENDVNFEVDINVDSVSPIENDNEKRAFVDFLTLTTQFPQIAFSPVLVREAAYRCGYKNEKAIREMMKMAQIAALAQEMQAKQSLAGMQGGPGPTNNLADQRVKQMAPPTQGQIQNQLQGQIQ